MIYVWLGALVMFLIIEFCTYDMVTIWFAVGAVCSLILSFFWDSIIAQIILFIIISAVSMIMFRNKVIKYLNKNKESTNVDAFIGKKVKLIKTADNMIPGEVKMGNGVVWNAVTEGEKIEENELVEIIAVEGNKLIVKKANQED